MVKYHRALAAILMMEIQQTVPAHRYEPEPEKATTGVESRGEACTSRRRVKDFIAEEGEDYYGRTPRDVHITASKLGDILGCSNQTARRRLSYFEEQGIVGSYSEGTSKHYELEDEYSGLGDDKVRSATQIVDAAMEALEAAEED